MSVSHEGFSGEQRALGRIAAWTVFAIGMVYLVITVLGLLSLKSSTEPIGDPYFSIMEVLLVLLSPVMVLCMVAIHGYASPERKAFSLAALVFMVITATITSGVHFVILTVRRQLEASGLDWVHLFLSFTWPSVAYALDILAWDFFFALSMLFAVPVFKGGRLETALRWLMIISGVLSLLGLLGIPLADMGFRNIGIVGYGAVGPAAFLLVGMVFGRTKPSLS
jgi:hypothetical protein